MDQSGEKEPPTCPRCGAYPGGCVRGCGGKPQHDEREHSGSTEP